MHSLEFSFYILIVLIALALLFDFMNGFHDAANAIATVVSTGVLKPQAAVVMAATFNFIAIGIFHLKVASTIGTGTIEPWVIDHYVVFGALVGAIRSEEHTSELQSLMRNSYDVFCLQKKKKKHAQTN